MRIFGKFADINGVLVSVDILTNGDTVDNTYQSTEEEEKDKVINKYKTEGRSIYEGAAEFEGELVFPRFKRAKELDQFITLDDFEDPYPGTDPGNDDPPVIPHDNLDVSINPPIVPDTVPADETNNNGNKTDVQEGKIWKGEEATYTIGEDGIWFAGNPFEINSETEDNFDVLIKQTAVLRLVTSKYLGHLLFSSKMRKSRIIVRKGHDTLFDGYLTMNVYNQPFNTDADQFEVQCVDKLATINFFNYKKTFPETYKAHKANSSVVSFMNVLLDALSGLDGNIWYDCSKSIDGSRWTTVFDDIGIGENVFYGDDFDGMMDREETLTEILQYLNLHIIQHKEDFYIFDWNTIKKGEHNWICLTDNTKEDNTSGVTKILTGDMHMAMDTDITIADVYSQVQVTCDVDEAEEILADMFESDDLKSYFNNQQLYMTEYISEGEGETARDCFTAMINDQANGYENGSMVDWYVQAMYNNNWTCNPNDPIEYQDIEIGDYSGDGGLWQSKGGRYVNQHEIVDRVQKKAMRAGFFRIGKLERKATELFNQDPVPKLNTTDYFYISVNGNEQKDKNLAKPSDAEIAAAEPILVYSGNTATGAFSPVDHETTNYLVFEGKLSLQPIQKESTSPNIGIFNLITTVPSENNEDGRFYARKWYKFFDCMQDNPTMWGWTDVNSAAYARRGKKDPIVGPGLMMPAKDKSFDISDKVDEHEDPFVYGWSDEGDETDRIRKVPVLECYLRIGDKKLVEYNFKDDGSSDFGWFKDGEEPYAQINGTRTTDNVKATTFTLGINPAIDDVILGTEFPIQNTIHFTMNIDGEGTAVPIKKEDALSGDIEFKILGPCTLIWDQVIRIHPSFWRHTSWKRDALPLLPFVENIILSDFSIKVVSDNAKNNDEGDDNDLMYVAQETDYNFNTKHETDFNIITQLDSATAKAKGIKNGVYLNAAVNMTNSEPLDCLYTKKEGKKRAEEHFVYDYLEDWRKSRITLTMSVKDEDIDFRNRYGSIPLKKSFNIIGISRDVKKNTAKLTMREYADGLNDFQQT